MGPNLRRLIQTAWDSEIVVPQSGGYFATPFHPTCGVRQGAPDAPTKFDILVDCVLRAWYSQVSSQSSPLSTKFYADDGRLAGYEPHAVQFGIDLFVDLFSRIGLKLNTDKTKFMVTFHVPLSKAQSSASYAHRFDCSLPSARRHKTTCPECCLSLNQAYLPSHLREIHHLFPAPPAPSAPVLPAVHEISFPFGVRRVSCPVSGCPASPVSRYHMRKHFRDRHPHDVILITEEGLLPRCHKCGLFVSQLTRSHYMSVDCHRSAFRHQTQEHYADTLRTAHDTMFHINGIPIERVDQFSYLGRILTWNDSDDVAILACLSKARSTWGRLNRILSSRDASPKVMARFYLAVVQAVLLYGSDSCRVQFHLDIWNGMEWIIQLQHSKCLWIQNGYYPIIYIYGYI